MYSFNCKVNETCIYFICMYIFVQCSILINFNFDRLRRKPISTNNKSHIENQILIPENWSMIFEG